MVRHSRRQDCLLAVQNIERLSVQPNITLTFNESFFILLHFRYDYATSYSSTHCVALGCLGN